MRHLLYLLAVLVLATLMGGAGPAAAQQSGRQDQNQTEAQAEEERRRAEAAADSEAFRTKVDAWEKTLNGIDERLADPAVSVGELEQIRDRLRALDAEVREERAPVDVRVEELKNLLAALGPAPKEGEAPEAEAAAAERERLQTQLAEAEARRDVLNVVATRIENDLARITDARSRAMTTQLLARGPQIWRGETWSIAATDAARIAEALLEAPVRWWRSPSVTFRLGSAAPFIAVLIIVAAVLFSFYLRSLLMRRFGRGRGIDEPSYSQQFVAACVEGAAQGLMPMAAAAAAYLLLLAEGAVTGLFGDMLTGALMALLLYFLVTGIARAALAPTQPEWRLPKIPNDKAKRLGQGIVMLSAIVAAYVFIERSTERFYVSRDLLVVYGLLMNTAIAVAGLAVLRGSLWRRTGRRAQLGWGWSAALGLGRLGLFAVPVLGILSFHRLAEFLALNIVASAGVLGASAAGFALLHNLLDLIEQARRGWALRIRRSLGLAEEGSNFLGFTLTVLAELGMLMLTLALLAVVWSVDLASVTDLARRLWLGISIGQETFALRDVLIVIIVFAVLVVLVRRVQRGFEARAQSRTRMDPGLRNALRAGIGYTGITIAALIAISAAGLDISNLALIAGALSVGIGFGLQAIVSNFVSGIILLVERPIKEGDWIAIEGHEGHVKRISVRSTEIVTFARASVVVPNSTLISSPVINWMHKDITGRIEIAVGVAYGSDTGLVRETLLGIAAEHPAVLKDPEPYVLFMNFGESSLDFELRCYLANVDNRLSVSSDLRFGIDQAFREAGITIPFPQRDLHVKDMPRGD